MASEIHSRGHLCSRFGPAAMCGSGFVSRHNINTIAATMNGTFCRHRGPDDEGVWIDPDVDPSIFRRTSPMVSARRPFLHHHLQQAKCHEPSLLERTVHTPKVVLKIVCHVGCSAPRLMRTVRSRPDRKDRALRDRLGIKPLYWASANLPVGSELKALRRCPVGRRGSIRPLSPPFMRHNYVPDEPHSIL